MVSCWDALNKQDNSRTGYDPRRQLQFGKGDARPLWIPHLNGPRSKLRELLDSK